MTELFDQDEAPTISPAEAAVALGATVIGEMPPREGALAPLRQIPALADFVPRSAKERTFLLLLAELPWVDSSEAGVDIALSLAMGDPLAVGEPLEARSVRNLKLANKPHTITSFAIARSSIWTPASPGPPVYASIEAAWSDGEAFGYSIGGWRPLGQLVAKHGHLPWRCQIIEIPTGQGNPAYAYIDVR